LLEVANRVEVQGSGLPLSEEFRRELEQLFLRYGGRMESVGHPKTTLEDIFLHIVKESKAHPGRRYRPSVESPAMAPSDGSPSTRMREGKPAPS
jgi:ABC-2 type transport system ATP-binding protein